jgi:hypothetical protein
MKPLSRRSVTTGVVAAVTAIPTVPVPLTLINPCRAVSEEPSHSTRRGITSKRPRVPSRGRFIWSVRRVGFGRHPGGLCSTSRPPPIHHKTAAYILMDATNLPNLTSGAEG